MIFLQPGRVVKPGLKGLAALWSEAVKMDSKK
jgi:hypothetical protein